MSHLLAISMGPVQEFIAAARRTRDLWFGSYLLSEVSKAAAKYSRESRCTLIFPHTDTNLEPGHPEINVANVVLAELTSGDPKAVAAEAKQSVQRRWQELAESARREVSSVIRDDNIWEDQRDGVIEFYAAWVPHPDPRTYQRDRARVMRLLAGRKNCRDFRQPGFNDTGLPKSSLDGQRSTVLVGPKPGESRETYRDSWPAQITRRLRLLRGEQLDIVGVVKRVGDGERPYPSVARVAAETWLRGIEKQGKLQSLKDACNLLVAEGLHTVREKNYDYFPYEGTVIYKDRHTDLRQELRLGDTDLDKVAAELAKFDGEPIPYLAVLVADGDSMGAKLSTFTTAEAHRRFSGKLADFAAAAEEIVRERFGVLIYAGGDDVLALLPLHTCLPCARELREKFHAQTEMNLSVGLAIGHFMENLEDLRDYGRTAEKAAKNLKGKDALAVHLHKRGGVPIRVRAAWSEKLDERLVRFAKLMNDGTIPTKLPYELRAMARLYESWDGDADRAIQQDLVRLIAKKQSRSVESVSSALTEDLRDMNAGKLATLAAELLVARQIAIALKQAGEATA